MGPDDDVYAGGQFTSAGSVAANSVAHWDGAAWRSLGSGIASEYPYHLPISALVMGPDGSLYVGGDFEVAGSVTGRGAARWDRSTSSWQPLGSGICDFSFYHSEYGGGEKCNVFALAAAPDGSSYAGGDFTRAGGAAANYIAQWIGGLKPATTIFLHVQHLGSPLDVLFVDPMHGWSQDGARRTTDSGQTWSWADPPSRASRPS